MSTIDTTLAERGVRYGEFNQHAAVTQSMKLAMTATRNWATLPSDMKEALEMVAHKIGRILNGDPNYIDSWTDIIGYTRLVEKRLIDEQTPTPLGTTSDRNTPLPKTTYGQLRGSWASPTAFDDMIGAVDSNKPIHSVGERPPATTGAATTGPNDDFNTRSVRAALNADMLAKIDKAVDSITGMAAPCSCEACVWARAKADVESGAKIDEKVDDLIILFFGPAPKA